MIRPPRRSVTRFFIPLIDVLTLLFCIFLLMPLVEVSGEGAPDQAAEREQRLQELQQRLDAMPEPSEDLRKELERLQRELMEALQQRLQVRVLEIDPANGTLHYHDAAGRVNITNQAEARELQSADRRDLRGSRREIYYIILYPRGPSRFPLREQREQYESWFAEVAHGWDIPGSLPPKGGRP